MFLFVFGIVCVNFYKGSFYKCIPPSDQVTWLPFNQFLRIGDKWECINHGLEWQNSYLNFDNIIQSMSTLFIMSSSIQWSETMYHASKSRGLDMAADLYGQLSTGSILLFMGIVVFGNFFIMNIFIGVILAKYNREKELAGKNYMLTESQKKWVKNRLDIIYASPIIKMQVPDNEWKQPFFYIAENKFVQNFIFFCIVINTIILSLSWYGQSESMINSIDNINILFTVIFSLEFVIKIIGYGHRFFIDGWNIFDMIIVFVTIIGIILSSVSTMSVGPQTTIIRSFRIMRIFFFFKSNRALKNTMMTFMLSVPAMVNIGGLILLINIIFSILGMYLFADIMPNGELNEYSHFRTFGTSFLTLIKIVTGEKWPLLLEAISKSPSTLYQCKDQPSYEDYFLNQNNPVGCGSEVTARIFFFSYSIIMGTVSMKLFIAIIWQTFQQTTERDNKFMSSDLVQQFREAWSDHDRDATSFMLKGRYPQFLIRLGEPLGWNILYQHNYLKQKAFLSEISLPKYNLASEYYFLDVLEHLILIMIIRREIINYAIKSKHYELLGAFDDSSLQGYEELIYDIKNPQREEDGDEDDDDIEREGVTKHSSNLQEDKKSHSTSIRMNQQEQFKQLSQNTSLEDQVIANFDNVRYSLSPPQNDAQKAKSLLKNPPDNRPQIVIQNAQEFNNKRPLMQKNTIDFKDKQKDSSLAKELQQTMINIDLQKIQKNEVLKDLSSLIQNTVDTYLKQKKLMNDQTESPLLNLLGINTANILTQSINQCMQQLNKKESAPLPLIQEEITIRNQSQQNQSLELEEEQLLLEEEKPTLVVSSLDKEIQEIEDELRVIKFDSYQKGEEGVRILTTKSTDNNNSLIEKRQVHSSLDIPENNKYQLQIQQRIQEKPEHLEIAQQQKRKSKYEEAQETVQLFLQQTSGRSSNRSYQMKRRPHYD